MKTFIVYSLNFERQLSKYTTLAKNLEKPTRKQYLLSMNILVGDEIQHRVIKVRKGLGYERVDQLHW
jgi:hypothetical protein